MIKIIEKNKIQNLFYIFNSTERIVKQSSIKAKNIFYVGKPALK